MLIRVIQISARGKRPAFAKATAWLTDTTLFWSKRSYDFFESRIAAERVPERQQFQFAVADRARR